jgi:hypothetical protein
MTSISATSTAGHSPLDLLKQELAKEVSSGTVSSTDETALSSALDDIDAALKNDASSTSTGARPSPDAMQSKIDDLIDGEVSSGKLTSNQAKELKTVFANAFAGGPAGAGGSSSASSSGNSGADATSGTDASASSNSSTDVEELLKTLLEALQKSDKQTTSSYSADGTNSSSATSTSLVLDYSA